MAATVANTEYGVMGGGPGGKWLYTEVTLDSAYAVGGEAVTAAALGLSQIKAVFIADNEDGYSLQATIAAGGASVTFKVWVFGNSSQSAATPFDSSVRDLSAVVIKCLIRGL